ncbi:MAG: HIT family protein [Planctomycetes bacterium]|nr:HIT family protein [Planctomycetota bacterium]
MSTCHKPRTNARRRVPQRVSEGNELAFIVADAFPVSPGHTLIISRRHVADFFALTDAELMALNELLRSARNRLLERLRPDGFNVGVNVGVASGQTVDHVHVHLIPRFVGDMEAPEGGIRNVIPRKRPYRT